MGLLKFMLKLPTIDFYKWLMFLFGITVIVLGILSIITLEFTLFSILITLSVLYLGCKLKPKQNFPTNIKMPKIGLDSSFDDLNRAMNDMEPMMETLMDMQNKQRKRFNNRNKNKS